MNQFYDKNSPFYAKIVERYCLNHPESQKKTYHIVLDLSESNIHYKVGDSLGILPMNDPEKIERLLKELKLAGDEPVVNKKGQTLSFREFLLYQANLAKTSKKFLTFVWEKLKFQEQRSFFDSLFTPENKDDLDSFIEQHEIDDILVKHAIHNFTAQQFCDQLLPLLPRFYSIASSMKTVGTEAHLTVGLNEYMQGGQEKRGVCSYFLCHLASLNQPKVPIYLQPSHEFTLPEESIHKPIIMIGPGTGIAPFRGFMQERQLHGCIDNWLFFGERHQKKDFLYEEFWTKLKHSGFLKLDVAFSRDQSQKIYVQDRLREQASEVWEWLEKGAYLFVCGDASKMAKDVEQTLQEIIQVNGKMDLSSAKFFLKTLRNQKRYLKDVY